MPLTLVTILIYAALVVLAVCTWVRPGVALALSWSMIAVEAVLQASNSYLLSNSSAFNFFIAAVAGVGAMRAILMGKLKGIGLPKVVGAYLLLTTFCFISLAWCNDYRAAMAQIKLSLPYIVVFGFVAPLCAVNEREMKAAINTTIFFGALVLLGIVLSETGQRGIILQEQMESNPLATASYAGFVGICAMFTFYGKTQRSWVRLLKIAIVGLAVFTIVKSGSRGQLVAFVIACFVCFPIAARLTFKRSTVVAFAVAVTITVVSIYLIDRSQWSARWQLQFIYHAQTGRLAIATEMLAHFYDGGPLVWLRGLGTSSSFRYLNTYPHNVTVETLCEEGLIGFLLLCAVVSLALRHVWQLMKSRLESESARINYGVLMAIAVFSIALSFKQGSLLGSWWMFSILISVGWLYSEAKNRRAKVRMRPVPLASHPPSMR